ncbi:MAG: transketolase [Desulfobacterales bacterium]|nr:transketolase [Desulfobacterales bacterium]
MTLGSSDPQCTLDDLCINTIRTLAMDAIEEARSGHPGAPMGLATAGYVLWTRVLRHNPENPQWPDRDRFVLSGGHASMLLYALLHLTGYDLSLDDIRQFRQWGSRTPGHPEYGLTPGVETTTGPLGQGIANAVGMAMAERHLAARFNRSGKDIVDHYTYVICGDGDLMEGVTHEAASLAGHLGLGRLICLYDDNRITIEGSTEITFTENVAERFSAMGWHTLEVADGNDLDAIEAAINAARAESGRPSLILLRTHIAFGSPGKQGSADAHGAPLGREEVCRTKKNLGCPEDQDFCVPEATHEIRERCLARGRAAEKEWSGIFRDWESSRADLAKEWKTAMEGGLAAGWDQGLPEFAEGELLATRAASGKALNAFARRIPELIGGSADLAPSNKTIIDGAEDFQKANYGGRNIRFGVREHAMGAILNGMALHRGVRPYGGTFLVFADYMRPAIRLAALMKLPVIYVFTHDSIAVGEDGPTHQPVEHLASLRTIPGLTVIRPADANETVHAWRQALAAADGPTALILSRQKLPVLPKAAQKDARLELGAYVLAEDEGTTELILIASGSEVHLALNAAERLKKEKGAGVRVVNMPSWELFEKADSAYRRTIFPPELTVRLAVEAGIAMGWERYVGDAGAVIAMNRFGASAPGGVVMERFGYTVDNVVAKAMALLGK